MILKSIRQIAAMPETTTEVDFSAGSVGTSLFKYQVKHQRITVVGFGFNTEVNSGAALAAGTEAILALKHTAAVTGVVTNFTGTSQLLSYPAAGIVKPDGVFQVAEANGKNDADYDPNEPAGYIVAERGDLIEIVINQLATAATQSGRPYLMFIERSDGTAQEGPT